MTDRVNYLKSKLIRLKEIEEELKEMDCQAGADGVNEDIRQLTTEIARKERDGGTKAKIK